MIKILGIGFLAFLFTCDIAVANGMSEKVAQNMFLTTSKTLSESCKSGDRNSCKALEETIARCHGDKSELCNQLRRLE